MSPGTMDPLKRHTSRSALSCGRYLLVHYLVKCEKQRLLRMLVALNMHIIYEIMSLVNSLSHNSGCMRLLLLEFDVQFEYSYFINTTHARWRYTQTRKRVSRRSRQKSWSEHKLEVDKRVCQNTNLKSTNESAKT